MTKASVALDDCHTAPSIAVRQLALNVAGYESADEEAGPRNPGSGLVLWVSIPDEGRKEQSWEQKLEMRVDSKRRGERCVSSSGEEVGKVLIRCCFTIGAARLVT